MTPLPFPDCVMRLIGDEVKLLDNVSNVEERRITAADSNNTVGIYAEAWDGTDFQIGSTGPSQARHNIILEHLHKNDNRVAGDKVSRDVAKSIRTMLYRGPNTTVALRQLVHVEDGVRERFMRMQLRQRYASDEISKAFIFVTATFITVETDIV